MPDYGFEAIRAKSEGQKFIYICGWRSLRARLASEWTYWIKVGKGDALPAHPLYNFSRSLHIAYDHSSDVALVFKPN